MNAEPWLQRTATGWRGGFDAMASPCELLLEGVDEATARVQLQRAQAEALRIEQRFSRYRDDSVVARLHAGRNTWQWVDEETALLLDFAAQCHALSGGLFDITSGVLRRAWRFDGGTQVPSAAAVAALRPRVGWHRLRWQRPRLWLPEGMELDFGGIGKEYAVDRTLALLQAAVPAPTLVNFGGDLACSGPRADGSAWQVGIERPAGALGHVLDPRTGWPVEGAPRSVTVAAPRCVEAGMLSTLALLRGPGAAAWLREAGVPHALIEADGAVHTHFDTHPHTT